MCICSASVIIPKDRKVTYAVAEKYPEFIDFYKVRRIKYSDETRQEVMIESEFFGLTFSWEGQGTKNKYEKISWTQSKGLLKGMKAEWFFSDLPSRGTKVLLNVTYSTRFALWDQFASLVFIRRTVPKILNCLKTACERF